MSHQLELMTMTDYTTKRCTFCQRDLPTTLEFFGSHIRHKDGLTSMCRECTRERKHKGIKRITVKDGMRLCSGCKVWKPLTREHFHYNERDKHGYAGLCIPCALIQKEQYRRSKGIPADPHKPKIEGMKYCRKCDTYYPATSEYFKQDKKKKDGFKYTCRTCSNKQSKSWRERNPDKQKQLQHAWYDEKGVEYHRDYNDRNREQARLFVSKRRARKRSLPDTLTKEEWQRALDYFSGRCAICGRPAGFWHTIAADHWIPFAHPDCTGTIATNIVPMCHGNGGCNNSKNDHDALIWLHKTYGKKKGDSIYQRIMDYFQWVKAQPPHGD